MPQAAFPSDREAYSGDGLNWPLYLAICLIQGTVCVCASVPCMAFCISICPLAPYGCLSYTALALALWVLESLLLASRMLEVERVIAMYCRLCHELSVHSAMTAQQSRTRTCATSTARSAS